MAVSRNGLGLQLFAADRAGQGLFSFCGTGGSLSGAPLAIGVAVGRNSLGLQFFATDRAGQGLLAFCGTGGSLSGGPLAIGVAVGRNSLSLQHFATDRAGQGLLAFFDTRGFLGGSPLTLGMINTRSRNNFGIQLLAANGALQFLQAILLAGSRSDGDPLTVIVAGSSHNLGLRALADSASVGLHARLGAGGLSGDSAIIPGVSGQLRDRLGLGFAATRVGTGVGTHALLSAGGLGSYFTVVPDMAGAALRRDGHAAAAGTDADGNFVVVEVISAHVVAGDGVRLAGHGIGGHLEGGSADAAAAKGAHRSEEEAVWAAGYAAGARSTDKLQRGLVIGEAHVEGTGVVGVGNRNRDGDCVASLVIGKGNTGCADQKYAQQEGEQLFHGNSLRSIFVFIGLSARSTAYFRVTSWPAAYLRIASASRELILPSALTSALAVLILTS